MNLFKVFQSPQETLEKNPKGKKTQKIKIEKKLINKYPSIEKDEKLKSQYIEVFTEKEKFIEQFLDTDWTNTLKQVKKVKEEKLNKQKSMMLSSKSEESTFDDFETSDEFEDFDDLERMKGYNEEVQKKFEKALPIKFVVTEIMQSNTQKTIRELVAPVLTTFDVAPQFGMFHVALLIGPWIIEWNDSALCIPRKAVSQAAILTTDIGEIASKSNVKEIVSKITDVIMEWNLHMEYDNNPKDHKTKGNCHNFVEAILQKIELQLDFPGAMGLFLKKMKETGKCDLTFETTDTSFIDKCNIRKKTTFASHQELDTFVNNILSSAYKNISDFKKERPGDFALLKSFDRAFWLRKMHAESKKKPVDDKYLPLYIVNRNDKKHLGCPFGDPVETLSVMQENSMK